MTIIVAGTVLVAGLVLLGLGRKWCRWPRATASDVQSLPPPGTLSPLQQPRGVGGASGKSDVSDTELLWSSANVKWGTRLGSGSFGSVYVVLANGLHLAAKCMMTTNEQERGGTVKLLRREAIALHQLKHPNVVQIVGIILDHPEYVALLMELANFGSLADALHTQPALLLSAPTVQLRLALHIAQGMAYLHARTPCLLHHDLKSANVLLFGETGGEARRGLNAATLPSATAKLCDFGLASGLNSAVTALQSTRMGGGGGGTLAYAAPEAFDEQYEAPAEVYAYGILLWELLTCEVPWASNPVTGQPFTQAALMRAVLSGTRPSLPPVPAEASNSALRDTAHSIGLLGPLAERCWQAEPSARPTFEMITRQLQLGLKQGQSTGGTTGKWCASPLELEEQEPSGRVAHMERPINKLLNTQHAADGRPTQDVHRSHKDPNDVYRSRVERMHEQARATSTSAGQPGPLAPRQHNESANANGGSRITELRQGVEHQRGGALEQVESFLEGAVGVEGQTAQYL